MVVHMNRNNAVINPYSIESYQQMQNLEYECVIYLMKLWLCKDVLFEGMV